MSKKKEKRIKALLILASYVGVGLLGGLGGYVIGEDKGRYYIKEFRSYDEDIKIAKVNGKVINGRELKNKMAIMGEMNKMYDLDEETLDSMEKDYIEYIITTEAVYEDNKDKIEVTEEEFQSHYEGMMSQVYNTLGITSEEEFLKKFKMSKEELEGDIRKELVVSKALSEKIKVSEEEIKKEYEKNKSYYKQVKASHIIITADEEKGITEEGAKKKAEELLKQIKEGGNFEEIAKANSMDGSAEKGGDLGFFGRDEMVKEFEDAVYKLKKGELGEEVVKTEFGYHIVKKTDEKESTLEEVREQIEGDLSHKKQDEYLKGLLGGGKVEVLYGIGKGKELDTINHTH